MPDVTTYEVNPNTTRLETKASELVEMAARCEVVDDDSNERAASLLKALKQAVKRIDTERKDFTKPLLDHKKKIDGKFKQILQPLEAAIEAVGAAVIAYTADKDSEPIRGDYGTASVVERAPTIIVENFDAVPERFILRSIDEAALIELYKSDPDAVEFSEGLGRMADVPGIAFAKNKTVASR